VQLDNELQKLSRILRDFADEEQEASTHKKDIKILERKIFDLREDIEKLISISKSDPLAEARRKTIMGRIKEGWDSTAEFSKKCYYIIGFSKKITELIAIMKNIDWQQWAP
jgi:ribosomal protein L17